MSAWKALSGELDPDVRTFAERLRLVIDRSGLGVAAVAERTGHERADWDAYANAVRPVPRSAVVALSDVTGADLGPLTAHWEHADRAWKRLLRERAVPEAPEAGAGAGVRERGPAPEGAPAGGTGPGGPAGPATSAAPAVPAVPAAPPAPADAADRTMRIRPVPPGPAAGPSAARAPRPGPSAARAPRRGSPLLYVAGIVGAALVVTAAVLLVDLGGTGKAPAAAPPPPATTTAPTPGPSLPEGVRCTGADCGGLDPEDMGCGGPLATTVARTRVGAALVEVRHSEACAAAWARISGGTPGDEVSVQSGTAVRVAYVLADGDGGAYTAMIPVASGGAARACAALTGGEDGCTGG
ncbi:DUF2690 domain-containing protein [Streptomyces roseolus]|uniref:DUF2690 domain-containing protein n=1 Tax=Streptomyces roseolus TaxID=67358 RepID=UPI001677DF25|nr:DUF2690 domain-containing protein [Streptomyces roseolus]GGR38164.1 hypothetical protein GCM10010282_33440 [Streptomyces roseolus]